MFYIFILKKIDIKRIILKKNKNYIKKHTLLRTSIGQKENMCLRKTLTKQTTSNIIILKGMVKKLKKV